MPTARGIVCLLLGGVALGLGRGFGLIEMYIIGAALIGLALLAIVIAVMRPLRFGVGRTITPPRLHVGAVSRVEVAIKNGATRSPVMQLTDRVAGTSGARLKVSTLKPGEITRAAYRLPTERRGLVQVGPVHFESVDPFGLAVRKFTADSVGSLVVYPEVIPLTASPPSPANERRSMSDTPEFLGGRSEEFHTLRPYVPGDDIRRINWRSSARHDELIIREDEAPTQNHFTIIVDNAAMPGSVALDRAASVAASLVSTMRGRSDPFRLTTLDGNDTKYVVGPAGIEQALSILALMPAVEPKSASLVQGPGAANGAVVYVTSGAPTLPMSELVGYSRIMVISLQPSVWEPAPSELHRSTTEVVGNEIHLHLTNVDDLASLWTRSVTTLLARR